MLQSEHQFTLLLGVCVHDNCVHLCVGNKLHDEEALPRLCLEDQSEVALAEEVLFLAKVRGQAAD